MTLREMSDLSLSSLVAAAYQSTTGYAYFDFDANAREIAAFREVGTKVGTCNLRTIVQHSVRGNSTSDNGDWKDLITFSSTVTTSAVETQFNALSISNPLPCGRVKWTIENAAGTQASLSSIVTKVLAGIV